MSYTKRLAGLLSISAAMLVCAAMAAKCAFCAGVDAGGVEADYLAICSRTLCEELEPLIELRRSQGLTPMVAAVEDIEAGAPGISRADAVRAFIKSVYSNGRTPGLKYVLIVGDAFAREGESDATIIPTLYLEAPVRNYVREEVEMLGSDNFYALMDGDDIPDIAVGRIPADSPAALAVVIRKLIDYETAGATGLWRRRISFFASEGHFGSVDKQIEKMVKNMVSHNILPLFDLTMTYANPKMEYFYPADEFAGKVLERFQENPLMMIYIGHGQVTEFDDVRFEGKRFPIMGLEDVEKLKGGKGSYPLVFIIACLTGYYDNAKKDSVGEELLASQAGPVGVFASSRVSDPYGNGVLAKELAQKMLRDMTPRIGDVITAAKRGMVENRDDDRKFIDKFSTLFMSKAEMPAAIREHLYLYNYLGDPATVIQFPVGRVEITAPAEVAPGEEIEISGVAGEIASGDAFVTFECEAVKNVHPIAPIDGLTGDKLKLTVRSNYANANNKVAVHARVAVENGQFAARLKIPAELPEGVYYVKVYVQGDRRDAANYAKTIVK